MGNGGGGGNRTRVRKCVHDGVYVRSRSFRFAARRHVWPTSPVLPDLGKTTETYGTQV